MKKLYDISPTVSSSIAVWPGDVPYQSKFSLEIRKGSNIDLGAITTTLHLGAHADARSHYVLDGETVEHMPLESYIGLCQVISVRTPRGSRIVPQELRVGIKAPRILFKTDSFPNPEVFNEDFCALSPELIQFLASEGVQLIGIDTPSVDLFDDKKLLSHQALAQWNIVNLEGLVLDDVPDGLYELIALPLKLKSVDASPVRAILRDL